MNKRTTLSKLITIAWWLPLILMIVLSAHSSHIDNGVSHVRLKYLGISWTMLQSHHYLIPVVNGIPYSDKPPLLFWLVALGWSVFGVSLVWIQTLICLLLAGGIYLSQAMYRLLFPKDAYGHVLLPYIFLGSAFVLKTITLFRVDSLLIFATLLTCLGIFQLLLAVAPRKKLAMLWIVLGTLTGLFAKGPIIYVFTLLPFLLYACYDNGARRHFWRVLLATLLGSFVFFVSWLLPVLLAASNHYSQDILYKQIADRQASYHGKSIFTYIFSYIPSSLMPWVIYITFLPSLCKSIKSFFVRCHLPLLIVGVSTIIFSAFSQKIIWYIYPAMPFLLMLLTHFISQKHSAKTFVVINKSIAIIISFILGLGFVLLGSIPSLEAAATKNIGGAVLPLNVIILMTSLCWLTTLYLCLSAKTLKRVLVVSTLAYSLCFVIYTSVAATLTKNYTHILSASELVKQYTENGSGVILYGNNAYEDQFTYNARTTSPITIAIERRQIKQWLQDHPQGLVIAQNKRSCPKGLIEIDRYQERKNVNVKLFCIAPPI
jgi:4-amino-4-deoxy-L-arabinose transferase-like glycosyltransferase